MARSPITITIRNPNTGRPIRNAVATFKVRDTSDDAYLYAAETGDDLANLTSGYTGDIVGFMDPGKYRATITAANYTVRPYDFNVFENAVATDVELADALAPIVAHVANTANPHNTTKTQVGLGNVDNTADAAKPISAAAQAALDAHANNVANPHGVTKSQVGLGSVDNTSDIGKPISAATQIALNAKATQADLTTHNSSGVAHADIRTQLESVESTRLDPVTWTSGPATAGKCNNVDATGGAKTVPLPTGVAAGIPIAVQKTDASTNGISITGTIRGTASSTLPIRGNRYETQILVSEGSDSWRPVADHKTWASIDAGVAAEAARAQAAESALQGGGVWGSGDGFLQRVGSILSWAPGQGGTGVSSEHAVKGGGAAVAATTVTLDRAPVAIARVGKVAVGVGLATCEIREVSSSATTVVTLNSALFYAHAADERVVYFDGWRVPLSWWGVQGNVSTMDNRAAMCAAARAVGKSLSTNGAPLLLDGQGKDIYVSGPVTFVQGTAMESFRLRAPSTYSGPMDGPGHPTLQTNAMMMLGQTVQRITYSAATNTFTATTAAGVATTHGMGVGSRLTFDPDAALPPGVVAGRVYRAVEVPTTSTFRVAQLDTDPAMSFVSDGSGWAHVGLEDNCKIYARKILIEGGNVGQKAFTAVAATDVFTTTAAHGFADGDELRVNVNGSLPGGILGSSSVYYARDTTSTTLKLAATVGGAAIDVTSDGAGYLVATRNALNGAILGMQQPSFTDHFRIDNCKGFGARIETQQSHWRNLEIINCGTNLEIGGTVSNVAASFVYIDGFNSEQADVCDVKIRDAHAVKIRNWHMEETEPGTKIVFDVRCPIYMLDLDGCWMTSGGGGQTMVRVESGTVGGTDYKIIGMRGTFPTVAGECIAIDDRDRGTYLDMWTDFAGDGFAEYVAWSTSATVSRADPHPYRWDGYAGQSEWWGAQKATLPTHVHRHGANKSGDLEQWLTWTAIPTVTLDLSTDMFTSTAHGLVENQEIHLNTGSATTVTGTALWVNDAVYRARNVTTNTFQVSHVPGGPLLNFATGSTTNWTIKKVAPLKLRINKDARIVNGQSAAIADADLTAGDSSWHFDPSTGAFVFKGKKTDNSLVSVPIVSAASQITFTPTGGISSTDLQSAIAEVALEAGASGDGGMGRTSGVSRRSGFRYPLVAGVSSSDGTLTLNQTYWMPFWVDTTQVLTELGAWATTAGASGALLRFGIHLCHASEFKAGALLIDGGTVTNETAASYRAVTISQSLVPGIYWVSITPQGAATGNMARVLALGGLVGIATVVSSSPPGAAIQSSVTGALPDPAAPSSTVSGNVPLVYGRFA